MDGSDDELVELLSCHRSASCRNQPYVLSPLHLSALRQKHVWYVFFSLGIIIPWPYLRQTWDPMLGNTNVRKRWGPLPLFQWAQTMWSSSIYRLKVIPLRKKHRPVSWNFFQFLRTTTWNMMIWEIFHAQWMSFGKLKKTLSYGYSFRDQQQRQGEFWNIQSTHFNGSIPTTSPWRLSLAWHMTRQFAFTTVVLDMSLQRTHLTICWFFTRRRTHMGLLFLKQRWYMSSRASWLQLFCPVLPNLSTGPFVCMGLVFVTILIELASFPEYAL